jgi:hypothetical protein
MFRWRKVGRAWEHDYTGAVSGEMARWLWHWYFRDVGMLQHLEAALAIADETQDEGAGNLIERALESVRVAHWPTLDPNLETFRKGKGGAPPRS